MSVYEQTDGFIPNQQTPPATSVLGTSTDPFTSIVGTTLTGTTVSGTTIGAGSNLYLGGAAVPKVYRETVDFVLDTAKTVTHSLNTTSPVVMLYGSGTGRAIPLGSGNVGDVARITALSGSSANALQITLDRAAPGTLVVVIG